MITRFISWLRSLASAFWREVAKFGTVGAVAFVVDNGLTWFFMHSIMEGSPAKARFAGATIATLFSWVANRWWTFRHRRQTNVAKEFTQFILINGVGIFISTGFTWIARYPMGITDNGTLFLAGVVGIGVATIVRFLAYRYWVFNAVPADKAVEDAMELTLHPERQPAEPVPEQARPRSQSVAEPGKPLKPQAEQ
ncbi:GtrA family protein [Arthrobacter caoxuetaonis]|uniref:GtrA family protein n=1 Tax=Arthrobacter caoxuetaonis TaxID=2886935 RepID=A0A9X1MC94_9MICC|nr:GtrA family protein [Arthrobacter caoxuetaonis]MCC3297293.1 GtrA family protein [Arthrobacter caoxuetaonis]USQ58155.1 GtrA family protein [Arthrobacter caoxuetaonis]